MTDVQTVTNLCESHNRININTKKKNNQLVPMDQSDQAHCSASQTLLDKQEETSTMLVAYARELSDFNPNGPFLKTMNQSLTAQDDVKTVESRRVGGVSSFLGDHFSMRFRQLSLLCFVSPWLPLAHLSEDCGRKVALRDTRNRLFRGQAVCGTLGSGLHV